MEDDIAQDVYEISLYAIVSYMNLVRPNLREWWINTGATWHVCSNKELFTTFKLIEWGKVIHSKLNYI